LIINNISGDNMEKLKKARHEIDNIDKEIAKLLEKRMEIVSHIGKYKKNNNLSIENKDRESIIFENLKKNVTNEIYYQYLLDIFKYILTKSKEMQKKL